MTTSKSIGDPALLAEVALVLGQCRFDVVHFNSKGIDVQAEQVSQRIVWSPTPP